PREQHRGEDPAPFDVVQPADGRTGRDGPAKLDDVACSLDGGGGRPPLPFVLECGQRDLSDAVGLAHCCAHFGGGIGAEPGAEFAGAAAGGAAAAPAPPPLNGGGCSTGCHSLCSGPIAAASTFLSDQLSPLPSFFGPPFLTPILAMKIRLSKSLRLAEYTLRARSLASPGLMPCALSRICLRRPRLVCT